MLCRGVVRGVEDRIVEGRPAHGSRLRRHVDGVGDPPASAANPCHKARQCRRVVNSAAPSGSRSGKSPEKLKGPRRPRPLLTCTFLVAGVHDHRAPSGFRPDVIAGHSACPMQPPRRCTTQCRRSHVEVPRKHLALPVLARPSGHEPEGHRLRRLPDMRPQAGGQCQIACVVLGRFR